MKDYKVSYHGWVTFDVEVKADSILMATVAAKDKVWKQGMIKTLRGLTDYKVAIDGVFESNFKEPEL